MRASGVLFLIVATAVSIDATFYEVTKPTEWWQTTTIYQIWPRSFKDSDGDGVGDLNGITSSLEHFVDMGVEAVWLSPIYKSPMMDSGYDISDYRDVNPIYGTLDDFKNLIARAKELCLKVLNERVVAFARELEGEKSIFTLFNWDNETSVVCSLEVFGCTADKLEVLVADIYSGIQAGDVFEAEGIQLPGKAAVVLREC